MLLSKAHNHLEAQYYLITYMRSSRKPSTINKIPITKISLSLLCLLSGERDRTATNLLLSLDHLSLNNDNGTFFVPGVTGFHQSAK